MSSSILQRHSAYHALPHAFHRLDRLRLVNLGVNPSYHGDGRTIALAVLRQFRGHQSHFSCVFQGTEFRDSLGFGKRLPRLDAVGLGVILTSPVPLAANAKPLERSTS
ncbi:MAG: hypothetical protein ABSH35_18225 [Isosphaeraceae bacterium]